MKLHPLIYSAAIVSLLITGCSNDTKSTDDGKDTTTSSTVPEDKQYADMQTPNFNADSAYHFVDKQVSFGPRVPNSIAHRQCGDYLVAKLKEYGADVKEQKADVTTWDNVKLNMRNIIGSFNPREKKRILLCAHWDTRPRADQDFEEQEMPIPGANDGASGVGVLLEVARQLSISLPYLGVDIIFFDAEDWGMSQAGSDSYCLGSQYWSRNPHIPNYAARFGILLDMVGAENAQFVWEENSITFAPSILKKVWGAANVLGYGNYFVPTQKSGILDDHYYINLERGIPTIDIIQYDPTSPTGFGSYWHTHADNMDVISKPTLKAVGQTLLKVVYDEKP